MRDRAPNGKPTRRSAMRSPRAGLKRPSLERAQRHDGMRSQAPAAPRFAATSRHSPLAEAVHRHIGLPWSNQRALSDDCPSMRICPPHPASRRGWVRRVPSRYGNVSGTLPNYIIRVAQTWNARKKRRLPCNDRTRAHQGICRYLRFCQHTLLRHPPPATKATRLCAPFARAASWALHDFLTSALHSAGTRAHSTPELSDSICADLGVRTPVSCGMNIGKVPVRCCVIETERPQLPSAPTAERSSPALLIFSKSK